MIEEGLVCEDCAKEGKKLDGVDFDMIRKGMEEESILGQATLF